MRGGGEPLEDVADDRRREPLAGGEPQELALLAQGVDGEEGGGGVEEQLGDEQHVVAGRGGQGRGGVEPGGAEGRGLRGEEAEEGVADHHLRGAREAAPARVGAEGGAAEGGGEVAAVGEPEEALGEVRELAGLGGAAEEVDRQRVWGGRGG